MVVDDLPVARPHQLDGVLGADACSARVARGAEPVVLWRARGPRLEASIGGPVHRAAKHLILEADIVGDDGRGEVVGHALASLEDKLQAGVVVGGEDLEGPEDLRHDGVEVLRLQHLLQGDEDRGGLQHAILLGRCVVLQLLAAEGEVGPGDLQQRVHVSQHLLRRVRQNGPNGQVVELAARRVLRHLLDDACLLPVVVDEADALGAALLAAASICILVALPGDVLKVVDVRPKDLPVEACIFNTDLALQIQGEVLCSGRGACELRDTERCLCQEVAHGPPAAMYQVHV
mmetsp:Transcript_93525/g.273861  ORF Transcript_93525/g.273861 Transcript_93525/m.273861 type:complete len:289 (+) Transcript_93525:238-1104(+)